jgi:hypothetical protein
VESEEIAEYTGWEESKELRLLIFSESFDELILEFTLGCEIKFWRELSESTSTGKDNSASTKLLSLLLLLLFSSFFFSVLILLNLLWLQ